MAKISRVQVGGSTYDINDKRIFIGDSEQWADNTLVPDKGDIYVYTDAKLVDEQAFPGIKVADGKAYLVDLPFVADDTAQVLLAHIGDTHLHVTDSERERWNNKVRCYLAIDEDEATGEELRLVFTTE